MDSKQFEDLCNTKPPEYDVTPGDLAAGRRTILLGYTCDRWSWHIYLKGGYLHRLVYDVTNTFRTYTKRESFNLKDLVPDKRVFPESVDIKLARMFLKAGIYVPYTPFDEARYARLHKDPKQTFHGLTREQVREA